MKEISFCPYCGAVSHKLMNYHEDKIFCRDCNTFFNLNLLILHCPKCDSDKIEDSDFPSPDGQVILHCKHCKKMFTAKDLIEKSDNN